MINHAKYPMILQRYEFGGSRDIFQFFVFERRNVILLNFLHSLDRNILVCFPDKLIPERSKLWLEQKLKSKCDYLKLDIRLDLEKNTRKPRIFKVGLGLNFPVIFPQVIIIDRCYYQYVIYCPSYTYIKANYIFHVFLLQQLSQYSWWTIIS